MTILDKNRSLMPYLTGALPNIAIWLAVFALYFIGVPIPSVLCLLCIYYGVRSFYEKKPAWQYLYAQLLLIGTIVFIMWLYFYAGAWGLWGLVLSALIVAGITVYRRRKLIAQLCGLWEENFLGENMDERRKRKEAKR